MNRVKRVHAAQFQSQTHSLGPLYAVAILTKNETTTTQNRRKKSFQIQLNLCAHWYNVCTMDVFDENIAVLFFSVRPLAYWLNLLFAVPLHWRLCVCAVRCFSTANWIHFRDTIFSIPLCVHYETIILCMNNLFFVCVCSLSGLIHSPSLSVSILCSSSLSIFHYHAYTHSCELK